ncbi:basic leucine zipper transcriptional factor ATF-like 2 [Rhynchocyon petersi]
MGTPEKTPRQGPALGVPFTALEFAASKSTPLGPMGKPEGQTLPSGLWRMEGREEGCLHTPALPGPPDPASKLGLVSAYLLLRIDLLFLAALMGVFSPSVPVSGSPWRPLSGTQDPECQRQQRKKQKNRAAAQRNRQRHTDKADTLHQQQECLEKHNRALQKEILALHRELAWWEQVLHLHQRLCPVDSAPPGSPGPHEGLGQPLMLQASSPPAQYIAPPPLQPPHPLGLLVSPLPSQPLSPTESVPVPVPPVQLSPNPVPPPPPAAPSLLGPSTELKALLLSPPALTAPLQLHGQDPPAAGKLGSSLYSPLTPLGLSRQQGGEPTLTPPFSMADWQALGVGPSPHPVLTFPLLSSAHVRF